jgi:hypothetical protein
LVDFKDINFIFKKIFDLLKKKKKNFLLCLTRKMNNGERINKQSLNLYGIIHFHLDGNKKK